MRKMILFEDDGFRNLLPLTYWRTAGELRCGYGSLYEHMLRAASGLATPVEIAVWCRRELAAVTTERLPVPVNQPSQLAPKQTAMLVNARLLATAGLLDGPAPAVQWHKGVPLVIHADSTLLDKLSPEIMLDPTAVRGLLEQLPNYQFVVAPRLIEYPWDLVQANQDMLLLGWKQASAPAELAGRICEGVYILNKAAVHVGRDCTIKPGVVLDAEHGPIYIGRNVTIAPNASIEGPCYIGDETLIQPGAVLRDAVSIGRRCKVGGELESSIIHGYSNKQHDGFLGHSYIAEWVNLAADTVNSDLKNTYGPVRVPINGIEVDSGQMFVGLTIGDHSKTGIGQMFPTGTVVGFGCNIATCDFSPKFVPSFTWLTGKGSSPYAPERGLDIARKVMMRRQMAPTHAEESWFLELPAYAAQFENLNGQ